MFQFLDPGGTSSGTDLGTELGTELKSQNGAAERPVPGIEFPPTPPKFNIASELRSSGLLGHFVPSQSYSAAAREEKKAPKWLPWIADLGTEFDAISKVQFRDLKTEARYVIGRTHAVLFANYRVDEKTNRAAGVRFAAQVARMGNAKRFADMTGREYIRHGIRLLQLRAGKPFHSMFDIETVVEWEDEPGTSR